VAARALAVTRSVVRVSLRVGAAARAIHGLVGPAVGQLRRYGLLDDLVRARNAAKLPVRRVRREAILRLDLPVRAAHPALEAVDDTDAGLALKGLAFDVDLVHAVPRELQLVFVLRDAGIANTAALARQGGEPEGHRETVNRNLSHHLVCSRCIGNHEEFSHGFSAWTGVR